MATTPSETPSVDANVRRVAQMLRAAHDMTPQQLGQAIGLTKAQIWDRLRGDKPFTVTEVAVMAQIFGVDPGIFIRGPEALLGGGAAPLDEASRQLTPAPTPGPPENTGGRRGARKRRQRPTGEYGWTRLVGNLAA